MRGIGDAAVGHQHAEERQREADPEQDFARHGNRNKINQQGEPFRPVEDGEGGDQPIRARRSADDRRRRKIGIQSAKNICTSAADDPAGQIKRQKMAAAQRGFHRRPKKNMASELKRMCGQTWNA